MKYKKYELKSINDFEADRFKPNGSPFQFHKGSIDLMTKMELDSMLTGSNKYAFLIIRNDSILYQFYNQNISDTSILPSFSVAKSFVSTMLEIAHEEGKIKSFDEPITNYLPELLKRDERFSNIKIQHVLDMRSGIKSSENYFNPLSDVLRLGFGKNIAKKAMHINIEREPNQKFEYKSINTQLLGMIIEKATGKKLQNYYYEKIYQPLHMQHDATWMVDDKKHREARAFCCLNMTALDYAKFGKLFLDKGKFNGKRIVSEDWVSKSTNPDTMFAYGGYKNQWWQKTDTKFFRDSISYNKFCSIPGIKILSRNQVNKDSKYFKNYTGKTVWFVEHVQEGFYARGLLNQYIIVLPSKNMLFIHFGNTQLPSKPLKKGFEQKINGFYNY